MLNSRSNRNSFRVALRTDVGQTGGVYIISVAARILEMHPQTLRKYERIGLVVPTRTMGMLRLYSEVDIARLRLIKHLVAERGLNLDGVQTVLSIFNRLVKMKLIVEKNSDSRLKIAFTDVLDEIFDDLSVEFS